VFGVVALVVALVIAATASAGNADWGGVADFIPDGWPWRRRRK
jgi:hypothetical protein